MNNYIPKVHILYAFPLDSYLREISAEQDFVYPNVDTVQDESYKLQDLWEEFNTEDRVIKKLIEVLTVNPGYDYEFYTYAKGRLGAMSVPLMLNLYTRDGEKFRDTILLDTIVHEIIHRFAASPRKEISFSTQQYWKYIRVTYTDCIPATHHHLIVYAVLLKIIPEIFTESQQKEIEIYYSQVMSPGYREALDMVKEKGPDYFIKEFTDRIVYNQTESND